MSFSSILNDYIKEVGCTSKSLAETSGVSASTISRYRSGNRVPSADSEQIAALAQALHALDENRTQLTEQSIREALEAECYPLPDKIGFSAERFDRLMNGLNISGADLARALNYDSSYISRIRKGTRTPPDREKAARTIAKYVRTHYRRESDLETVAQLLEVPVIDTVNIEAALVNWLLDASSHASTHSSALSDTQAFLDTLDTFNLSDYLKAVKFDELKLPTLPFHLPTHKYYYKLEGMREASLDFEKAVATSANSKHVVMASTMSMEDMAQDPDFPKKWLFGLGCMIKRGVTIDMIHDLNRPFKEMMMGLEAYVPLYMTGQVNPWYFPDAEDGIHYHHDWISDDVVLTGEAVVNAHENGRYYLTNSKSEMPYFQQRAKDLLSHALPAMLVFAESNKTAFESFLKTELKEPATIRSVMSTPPLFTLNDEELLSFLGSKTAEGDELERVAEAIATIRELVLTVVENGSYELHLPSLENREEKDAVLRFPEACICSEIGCTARDLEHLYAKAESFAECHENFSVVFDDEQPFSNIRMHFNIGKWVLISKEQAPLIHFVIEHPTLRRALESYQHPIVEGKH